jgi:hypothetical protein
MEITNPYNIDYELTTNQEARLNLLLAANAEIARRKTLYATRRCELAACTMSHPLDFGRTYALLGLLLGTFPPASFFLSFLVSDGMRNGIWIAVFLLWVNIVTAAAGYFTGKVIGMVLSSFGQRSFTFFALVIPLIGFLWGAVSGVAGGVFIFVVGAFFGAMLGGMVGAVALPLFFLAHRFLRVGDMLELKHFMPIAFAITFSICAIVLRLLIG